MGRKGAMGRKALESVYQNLPKKERGEILHVGFGHKFLRPINISLKIYHFVTIGELCDIKNWKILLTNKPGRVYLKRRGWYNIENPEGFLNKNTVAGRQLPVLAHQRIFAVSAYLHGIMRKTPAGGRESGTSGGNLGGAGVPPPPRHGGPPPRADGHRTQR